jgi:Ser/Thr protein kinase RdoA (MazF antagonist)
MVLTNDDIRTIAHAFALDVVRVRPHTANVFRLETSAAVYALRFANAGVSRAHVLATQLVRRALAAAGLPVVAPLTAGDGSALVDWDGLLGEVQPWMAHTGDGTAWSRLITAATTLRHLHNHLAGLHVQPDQHDDPWRTPAELADQLAADRPLLRRLAAQDGIAIDRYLAQALAVLEALQDGGVLNGCPRQLTHGDYQGRNLLFQGRALSGIIDFERLEYRPRLYDVAWPFVFWRWFGTARGAYTAADWRQARACCSAYAAARPENIADSEWAVLPLLMAYIPARGIAQAGGEDAPIGEVLAFGRAMEFAVWLVEHPDAAVARLRS